MDPDAEASRAARASSRSRFDPTDARLRWWERRQERVREEIERNRRGEYTVPTWVLVLALLAIVGAWLTLIILA